MAVDLSRFVTRSQRDQRRPCMVGDALAKLPARSRREYEAALEADGDVITPAAIVGLFKEEHDLDVSPQSLSYHRRHKCRCYPR